jgi:hypothetical protein
MAQTITVRAASPFCSALSFRAPRCFGTAGPVLAVAPPVVEPLRPPLVAVPPSDDRPPVEVAPPPLLLGKATNGVEDDALPPVAEAVTPPLSVDQSVDQSSGIDPPEPAGLCR